MLDYAGEQVIRFGDDFRTTNITGSGELFTLVFRLREGVKPSLYSRTKTLDFEVGLKGFDLYDADLHFVRAEMTQAGTVTVRTGNAEIREIEVGGVGLPFAGQKPAATAVLPAGATYKLLEDQDLAPFGSVFWVEMVDGKISHAVAQSETFQAGHTYQVTISLVPASDAYSFAPAAELRGTINGKWEAEIWVDEKNTEAALRHTFTCEEGVPASGLVLDQTDAALEAGESTSLQVVTYIPHNAEDLGVAWSSSDPDVASVDPNGLVTALREGAAVITVTAVNGGVQASCTVTVSKRQHTILTVGAEGVAEPAVGLNPLFSARVPAGAHYKVSDSSVFGGGVVWLEKDGETFYRMKETEAFRAGVTYRIWVYLSPEETGADCYRFPAAE